MTLTKKYNKKKFIKSIEDFEYFNEDDISTNKKTTQIVPLKELNTKRYVNEFWTSKQRQGHSLHEISYRACFKPQLPRFFIEKLSQEGDSVYDPFLGRGTTIIEAALLSRQVIGNDINPLSKILSEPRLTPPDLSELSKYLDNIKMNYELKADIDLSMFFHPKTESEIVSLKQYFINKNNNLNSLDKWIQMVATNRLTGHSKGFFSVYTMPPNQAVLPQRQIKINKQRNQSPEYRNVVKLILKKTKSLIRNLTETDQLNLSRSNKNALFLNDDARDTKIIEDNSVQLTITSPPFLDVVQYAQDNWLRCWFNNIDANEIEKNTTMSKKIEDWETVMQSVFDELYRITKKDGFVAFEVGEVRNGKIKLDEYVIPLGRKSGFSVMGILINDQDFTKTANVWGIKNNKKGTNTNRIVVMQKQEEAE